MGKVNADFIRNFSRTRVNPSANRNGTLPGSNTGMNVAQIRKATNELPRALGVKFITQVGSVNIQNINLPGDVRLFLGIIFLTQADDLDQFTLTINNNLIVQSGSVKLNTPFNSQAITTQYFEYPQALSGKDSIEVTYQSSVANINNIIEFHFI
jgi:hypothetical protein